MESVWWLLLFVVLSGGGVGSFIRTELNQRRERKRDLMHGPKPVCGCSHHFSFHDPKTGLCMHNGRTAIKWDEFGSPSKWEIRQCGCQRYIGPQPMESLYATEITNDYIAKELGEDR